VPPYGYNWEWWGWDCPGGDLTPPAGGGQVSPNTIVCGWQYFSADWTIYFVYHQRTLRLTVTSLDGQQAQATYVVP
jgi:hypothetical protein